MKIKAVADFTTNQFGNFKIHVVESSLWPGEHVVLVKGNISNKTNVPCRIQSSCLPGFVFDYDGCDCKEQWEFSLKYIREKGIGMLIYLDQEGRGHGLTVKIQALNYKNKGLDTFEAVKALGLKEDIRNFKVAVEIIKYFNPFSILLITNNPQKVKELREAKITITEVIHIPITKKRQTLKHLLAKKTRGHFIYFKEE